MNFILACNELGITIEDSLNQWLPGQDIYYQTQGSSPGSVSFERPNKQNQKHIWNKNSPNKNSKNKKYNKKFRKRRQQHAAFNSGNNNNNSNNNNSSNLSGNTTNLRNLDQQTQKELSLTGQAFAFQTFQFFGIREIIRCDQKLWKQMSDNLKENFENGYRKYLKEQEKAPSEEENSGGINVSENNNDVNENTNEKRNDTTNQEDLKLEANADDIDM